MTHSASGKAYWKVMHLNHFSRLLTPSLSCRHPVYLALQLSHFLPGFCLRLIRHCMSRCGEGEKEKETRRATAADTVTVQLLLADKPSAWLCRLLCFKTDEQLEATTLKLIQCWNKLTFIFKRQNIRPTVWVQKSIPVDTSVLKPQQQWLLFAFLVFWIAFYSIFLLHSTKTVWVQ